MSPKNSPRGPKSLKSFPKPPPNPSKWSPRRSQIRSLKHFLACFFPIVNSHPFFVMFSQKFYVCLKAEIQISCAHAVFCWLLHCFAFFHKITKIHRKIVPKSIPNPSQNLEKSIQNPKKRQQNTRWVKMRQKNEKKSHKSEKSAPRPTRELNPQRLPAASRLFPPQTPPLSSL